MFKIFIKLSLKNAAEISYKTSLLCKMLDFPVCLREGSQGEAGVSWW